MADEWDFSDIDTRPKRAADGDDGLFRLSYSGSTTLEECEQKFVYSRIQKLSADPDSGDSYALNFGSAFHYVCENTMHLRTPEVPSLTQQAIRLYDLEAVDYYKLAACLERYFRLHLASKLKVIACEVEVRDPGFYLGYVDAIMVNPADDGWWICDLKTASQPMLTTFRRLCRDPQLNLYASYKEKIAKILNLDVKKFQGCIYRTTIKAKLVPKKGETVREYLSRVSVASYSIYIRAQDLHVTHTRDMFQRLFERAAQLKAGAEPLRNYTNCGNWNRACEFWSQCHGRLFSESNPDYLHEACNGSEAPPSIFPDDYWDF